MKKAKQDAEFARLIAEGDANVKNVKFKEAITNFKAALTIRPKDPGAIAKLAEAEKLLAAAIEKAGRMLSSQDLFLKVMRMSKMLNIRKLLQTSKLLLSSGQVMLQLLPK